MYTGVLELEQVPLVPLVYILSGLLPVPSTVQTPMGHFQEHSYGVDTYFGRVFCVGSHE